MKTSLWIIMSFLFLTSVLSFEETIYYLVWQQRTAEAILAAHWPSGELSRGRHRRSSSARLCIRDNPPDTHFSAGIEPFLTGCVALGVQILLTLRASAFFPKDYRRGVFLTFNFLVIALSFCGACMVTAVAYMCKFAPRKNEQLADSLVAQTSPARPTDRRFPSRPRR